MLLAVGVLLVIVGGVWFLQGVDVLGGSGMSGRSMWAVVGAILVVVGAGALVLGIRRRAR
jgi:hypothetical protein